MKENVVCNLKMTTYVISKSLKETWCRKVDIELIVLNYFIIGSGSTVNMR